MSLTETFLEKKLGFVSVQYDPERGYKAAVRDLASEGYRCGQRWHETAEAAVAEHFELKPWQIDPEILDL